ncbi:hypothetical protein BKI52_19440 [marine bacterium AO1-C]|nr:hypothetical protein BKI52_19440 [marine bacterium AO1-C]
MFEGLGNLGFQIIIMVLSLNKYQMFKSKFQNIRQGDVLSKEQQRMVKGGAIVATTCSNGSTISCRGTTCRVTEGSSCSCTGGTNTGSDFAICPKTLEGVY